MIDYISYNYSKFGRDEYLDKYLVYKPSPPKHYITKNTNEWTSVINISLNILLSIGICKKYFL